MSGVCPASWAPLADADPIGGDVAAVGREARRYQDMAVELRDQVVRLRRIAGQEELFGRTADKLREAAEDLSGKLADTVGRFERVGSALQEWVPHLEHAQDVTLIALRRAQEAQHQQAAYAPSVVMGPPSPEPPTDVQVAAERRRVGLHDEAAADLHAARARFDEAVDEHHRRARAIAARLEEAADDQLTDSGWEQFKGWVHEHAETIKKITEVLSLMATALAFVAIFVPGVNILVLVGLGLLVVAGHAILAATGEGSWTDVALDAFALVTLGAGAFAARGIKSVQLATRASAAKAAGRVATRQQGRVNRQLTALLRKRAGASGARLRAIDAKIRTVRASRGLRAVDAAKTVLQEPLPHLGEGLTRAGRAVTAGGDLDSAARAMDVLSLAGRFRVREVLEVSEELNGWLVGARVAYGSSTSADIFDKAIGSSTLFRAKSYWRAYDDGKGRWAGELGSAW